MAAAAKDVYTHGHAEVVASSHAARTAAGSAAYLLPLLRPGLNRLDVGCGPGNITVAAYELHLEHGPASATTPSRCSS